MRVSPAPPAEVSRPLEHVLDQASAMAGAEPEVVLVEDLDRSWMLAAASLDAGQRARSVVAARSAEALLAAVRLGISGAFWLPPSTVTAAAALRRVAEARPVPTPDPALVELTASYSDLLLVTVANAPFWRCQLGDMLLAVCLEELAGELGRPAALVPGPSLVVGGRSGAEIVAAWGRVTAPRHLVTDGVRIIEVSGPVGHRGVAVAAMAAMAGAPADDGAADELPAQPVYELPRGVRAGWWRPRLGPTPSTTGWLAVPIAANPVGYEWRLTLPDGSEATVADAVDVPNGLRPAARVPGWLAVTAVAGSPAGLLVERMATAAHRAGCSLWLPGVDASRLHFALSLRGSVWIDGPAVPDAAPGRVDSASHSP